MGEKLASKYRSSKIIANNESPLTSIEKNY